MINLLRPPFSQPGYLRFTGFVNGHRGRQLSLLLMLSLWAAVIAGCAGAPATPTRYTLPMPDVSERYLDNKLDGVVIEPVRITRYLDGEGIVMQMSDIEVQQARNHLWAEPLSRQLGRNLRQYLSIALPGTRVLREAAASQQPNAPSVRVEVEGFQGRFDGSAIVNGYWEIRDTKGQIRSRQRFDVERVLDADGYPALVRNLAQSWGEVAAQIAAKLAEMR